METGTVKVYELTEEERTKALDAIALMPGMKERIRNDDLRERPLLMTNIADVIYLQSCGTPCRFSLTLQVNSVDVDGFGYGGGHIILNSFIDRKTISWQSSTLQNSDKKKKLISCISDIYFNKSGVDVFAIQMRDERPLQELLSVDVTF